MSHIIFFDTETSGNTEKDFLCQIAYKTSDKSFSGLYKCPIKIPPEASAVHHITNKMLSEKCSFRESPEYSEIKSLFENPNSVVVAHNAVFDLMMLKKEDILPANFICTLRLARYLDDEGVIERYNLQYLRYLLEIEIDATAHDALGDVLVLEKLYERLKNKIIEKSEASGEKISEEGAVQKMIEISSHPSIFKSINFGKYNGKKIEEIASIDRGYLKWLFDQKMESGQMEEDWIYTLKHYLNK